MLKAPTMSLSALDPSSSLIVFAPPSVELIIPVCGWVHKYGYNKAKLKTDDFKPYVEQAIQNAKALDNNYSARWPSQVGTHVYKIVEQVVEYSNG